MPGHQVGQAAGVNCVCDPRWAGPVSSPIGRLLFFNNSDVLVWAPQ